MRKCKIVATIGPASQSYASLEQLVKGGMNVARLNFSHGTHEDHRLEIEKIRQISKEMKLPIGILQDLQGPKLRLGIVDEPITLIPNEHVSLVNQGDLKKSGEKELPIDFPELFKHIVTGDKILIDDGQIQLVVEKSVMGRIETKVISGGILTSHKGINLPGIVLDIPAFTQKDEDDLVFGLNLGVDAIAISFVRTVDDVIHVRQLIQGISNGIQPLLIAKLEKPEGVEHLEEIIEAADGVMVARGDLGVEMPLEDVPIVQKRIIRTANQKNKLVITATQMLESMIHSPTPTRAEASDVANAIFDGTDMVMLSGETAIGDFPVESVSIMDRIIKQSERAFKEWGYAKDINNEDYLEGFSIVKAARELAHDRDVAAIAVFTRSGRSAELMAKMRPKVPIVAFTPEEKIFPRLTFLWGVHPHRVDYSSSVEEMINCVEQEMVTSGLVKVGQQVVLIFGYPVGTIVPPNMILLHQIVGN